jgi:hypothetical protein
LQFVQQTPTLQPDDLKAGSLIAVRAMVEERAFSSTAVYRKQSSISRSAVRVLWQRATSGMNPNSKETPIKNLAVETIVSHLKSELPASVAGEAGNVLTGQSSNMSEHLGGILSSNSA